VLNALARYISFQNICVPNLIYMIRRSRRILMTIISIGCGILQFFVNFTATS